MAIYVCNFWQIEDQCRIKNSYSKAVFLPIHTLLGGSFLIKVSVASMHVLMHMSMNIKFLNRGTTLEVYSNGKKIL